MGESNKVKRYCINRVRGEDCLIGIYEPPNGHEQFVTAEIEFVLASAYDALQSQLAHLTQQRDGMQAVVNAASILEQCVNSDTQGSEEHYDAQQSLCDAVNAYRAALTPAQEAQT